MRLKLKKAHFLFSVLSPTPKTNPGNKLRVYISNFQAKKLKFGNQSYTSPILEIYFVLRHILDLECTKVLNSCVFC